MAGHFIAASGQEFVGTNSVVPQKPVHTMRIFITRTVVMKRECATEIASQEKCKHG